MAVDAVLAEIRSVREQYALQFQGDMKKLMDDLRRRHNASAQGLGKPEVTVGGSSDERRRDN